MKNLFKTIALFLITTLSSIIIPKTVFAKTDLDLKKIDNKSNFNFINIEPNNTEYTYEENGKQYKVIEKSNKEFNNINTEIFVKNQNNEYISIKKYNTTIYIDKNNNIKITKNENGKQKTNIMKIEETPIIKPRAIIGPEAGPGTWEVVRRYNGNEYFTNFTYSVIVGILISIVSGGLGLGHVASSIVGVIAGNIVNKRIPSVYFKRTVSYYRIKSNRMVTKVESYNQFYQDKSYRYYIGTAIKTWTGKFPW